MLRVAEHAELTDTGRQRRANEDAFLARAPLFVVADGMGGAQAGEVASATAIEVLAGGIGNDGSLEQRLSEAVQQANAQIHALSVADEERAGMGTTITAAYIGESNVTLVHVGDSRCYRWRSGTLERLTDDHSLVEEMVRQGQLTPEQALEHPQRSIITRALGPEPVVEPDSQTVGARDGDLLLLCSDGLSTMITDDEIAAVLAREESLRASARGLIAAANEAGGRDNITVVLLRIEELDGGSAIDIEQTQVGLDVGSVPLAQPSTEGVSVAAGVERRMPRAPRAPAAKRRRRWKPGIGTVLALFVAALLLSGVYFASQAIYFVGADREGFVSVYQGVP
ncbi:MAG: Stp1/IreP family PP2C-type Ser/Thr phosphatase, partial [Actinobacteria bacterium]|nr:Stp1/IreP family PP2C-type Ser/Thr phosphatase [Actinomycetota bacterium]